MKNGRREDRRGDKILLRGKNTKSEKNGKMEKKDV